MRLDHADPVSNSGLQGPCTHKKQGGKSVKETSVLEVVILYLVLQLNSRGEKLCNTGDWAPAFNTSVLSHTTLGNKTRLSVAMSFLGIPGRLGTSTKMPASRECGRQMNLAAVLIKSLENSNY